MKFKTFFLEIFLDFQLQRRKRHLIQPAAGKDDEPFMDRWSSVCLVEWFIQWAQITSAPVVSDDDYIPPPPPALVRL